MNKEINVISDNNLTINICSKIASLLVTNNLIRQEDIPAVKFQIGYIFKKVDGILEGLIKATLNNTYYIAVQNGNLLFLEFNENLYNDTVNKMKELHPCLNETHSLETEEQKNRRINNTNYIKSLGVTTYDELANINYTNIYKDLDTICKRAIACLLTVQIACDVNAGGNYNESLAFFKNLLNNFGVMDSLNSKEKRIIDGTYTSQDLIDMDWAYESYWTLCWALNLVDDIKDSNKLCDCEVAMNFVRSIKSYEEFKNKCHLRTLNEILDMQDLYFRYNWAINNKKLIPSTQIGNLNGDNIIERRRALDWLLQPENDWYNIEMNT